MKITETTSVTYKVRGGPCAGWADITLREWPEGGSFMCQSDFGEFSHIWGSIGKRSFTEFLCGLDKDYFLKKTCPKDYLVHAHQETCKAIKKDIIQIRKELYITPENARTCWDECTELESELCVGVEAFFHYFSATNAFEILYHGDYSAVPTRQRYNPRCDAFWEKVWPHITEYWMEKEGLS